VVAVLQKEHVLAMLITTVPSWHNCVFILYFCYMRLSSFDIILIEEVYIDISNDYFRKLEIDKLCEKYTLDKEKLIKGFKKIYGTDIRDYYTAICMEYARKQIADGVTLTDLSFVFDYTSVQKFSLDFKQYLRHSRM
jgi:AraC-like DNA-binding protein